MSEINDLNNYLGKTFYQIKFDHGAHITETICTGIKFEIRLGNTWINGEEIGSTVFCTLPPAENVYNHYKNHGV